MYELGRVECVHVTPAEPDSATPKTRDRSPVNGEGINVDVLTQLGDGERPLRGNSLFGPGSAELVLDVRHGCRKGIVIHRGADRPKPPSLPWPPTLVLS